MLVLSKKSVSDLSNLVSMFMSVSKYFNNKLKEIIKMYSDGDGFLNFLMYNGDIKLNYRVDISSDVKFEKYFIISNFNKIIGNLSNYDFVEFDVENDIFVFVDGKVKLLALKDIDKLDFIKDSFVVNNNLKIYDKEVDVSLINNINVMLDVFKLRNTKYRNNYYVSEGNYYFDFFDVYCFLNFENSLNIKVDFYALKVLKKILELSDYSNYCLERLENRVIFTNNNVYFEFYELTNVANDDDVRLKLLKNLKTDFNVVADLNISNSFVNFLSMIDRNDIEVSLYFDNKSKSFVVDNDFISANFKNLQTDINEDFIINLNTLKRVFSFIKSKSKDSYEFKYIIKNSEKYLCYRLSDNFIIYINLL